MQTEETAPSNCLTEEYAIQNRKVFALLYTLNIEKLFIDSREPDASE